MLNPKFDPTIHKKVIMLRTDDSEKGNYTEVFQVTKKYNVPITIGVTDTNISNSLTSSQLTWNEVKELYENGWELSLHCPHNGFVQYAYIWLGTDDIYTGDWVQIVTSQGSRKYIINSGTGDVVVTTSGSPCAYSEALTALVNAINADVDSPIHVKAYQLNTNTIVIAPPAGISNITVNYSTFKYAGLRGASSANYGWKLDYYAGDLTNMHNQIKQARELIIEKTGIRSEEFVSCLYPGHNIDIVAIPTLKSLGFKYGQTSLRDAAYGTWQNKNYIPPTEDISWDYAQGTYAGFAWGALDFAPRTPRADSATTAQQAIQAADNLNASGATYTASFTHQRPVAAGQTDRWIPECLDAWINRCLENGWVFLKQSEFQQHMLDRAYKLINEPINVLGWDWTPESITSNHPTPPAMFGIQAQTMFYPVGDPTAPTSFPRINGREFPYVVLGYGDYIQVNSPIIDPTRTYMIEYYTKGLAGSTRLNPRFISRDPTLPPATNTNETYTDTGNPPLNGQRYYWTRNVRWVGPAIKKDLKGSTFTTGKTRMCYFNLKSDANSAQCFAYPRIVRLPLGYTVGDTYNNLTVGVNVEDETIEFV